MTKYFVDGNGTYLGGLDGAWVAQGPDEEGNERLPVRQSPEPPESAIEVPEAPEDARQVWENGAWTAAPAARQLVLKSVVQARIIAAGKMPQAYAVLTANPIYFARWFAPDHPAVYCDDPDAVGLVRLLGLDPVTILAP
ncbi:hypothetical protein [Mesorhizobium sp. WSM4904]|uniref:hypothetical protein n=1 Tax=Mesorhizobium sp. WSM4904 TaxID=3038545 RepID=UPI0024185A58|nr:hypothetical protein [Mesorhizobium sp. WSM4904]WFP61479.1 hypothetical protein QAZ47_23775 [Mesorhizobium sp. WSM4904]